MTKINIKREVSPVEEQLRSANMKPTITLFELLADIASGQYQQMAQRDYYLYADAPFGSLIRSVSYERFTADILVCPDGNELLIEVYTYCGVGPRRVGKRCEIKGLSFAPGCANL